LHHPLRRSIEANPSSKEAHLEVAKLLTRMDDVSHRDEITYQLRLSFVRGDANLDAQFWFARQSVLYGDAQAGYATFRELAKAETHAESRNAVKGIVLTSDGKARRFVGSVDKLYDTFCFIKCADIKGEAFAHSSEFSAKDWARGTRGALASFDLAFTFKGPMAMRVTIG
jgi:predicted ATPase